MNRLLGGIYTLHDIYRTKRGARVAGRTDTWTAVLDYHPGWFRKPVHVTVHGEKTEWRNVYTGAALPDRIRYWLHEQQKQVQWNEKNK